MPLLPDDARYILTRQVIGQLTTDCIPPCSNPLTGVIYDGNMITAAAPSNPALMAQYAAPNKARKVGRQPAGGVDAGGLLYSVVDGNTGSAPASASGGCSEIDDASSGVV